MEQQAKAGSQGTARENHNPRDTIRGWRLHPRAACILLGVQLVALALTLLVPKEHMALRMMPFTIFIFCGGVAAAGRMAIWQREELEERQTD